MGVVGRYPSHPSSWRVAGFAVASAAGLVLTVVACGGDDDGAARSGDEPMATDARPTTSATAPSTAPQSSSVSPRTTATTVAPSTGSLAPVAVPPGVPAQFEAVQVGDGPCAEFTPEDGPLVTTGRPTEFVLTDVTICLPGFDPEVSTEIEVVAADGAATHLSAPLPADGYDPATVYQGIPYVPYGLELYAPEGTYAITATQGAIVVSTTFEVGQPPVGRLLIAPPTSGSPGASFVLQLAGLPPGEPAAIDVYVQRAQFTYVTTIETPATDGSGRVEDHLATSPSDPPGVYCFVIRGSLDPTCSTGEVVKLA